MKKHRRTQIVRTYECDSSLRLKPESILHWIQDIAEEHASNLGFGYDMCCRQQLAWVETRLLIHIRRMPLWKETVDIETWSYPLSPVVAGREFSMTTPEGELLIEAATQWVLIDVQKRRPVALKKHVPYFSESRDVTPGLSIPGELPEVIGTTPARSYRAEYHHVDFNRHVNNSVYLLWALDSLPGERQNVPIASIRIDFKKESMPGDIIDVHINASEACHLFSLASGQTERARVRLGWLA